MLNGSSSVANILGDADAPPTTPDGYSAKAERGFARTLGSSMRNLLVASEDTLPKLKVALFTFGSRGDMQPMFALAAYLERECGMELLIFTTKNNVKFCEKLGLECIPIWPSVDFDDMEEALLPIGEKAKMAMRDGDAAVLMEVIAAIRAHAMPTACPTTLAALTAFKADLLLTGPLDAQFADAFGIVLRIPCMLVGLQLVTFTSQTKSMLGEPVFHYAAWMAIFLLMYKLSFVPEAALIRAALPELGDDRKLQGEISFARLIYEVNHPLLHSLIGFSEHVLPKPTDLAKDYDARCTMTGFWVVNREKQVALSSSLTPSSKNLFGGGAAMAELTAFLAADPAPVYLGWGSMIAGTPEVMARLAVRALKLSGQRGVVLGGFARLEASMLHGAGDDAEELMAYAKEHVLFVTSAPHEWLFSQCSVLVHHGGSGTTAASLRSGKPTVVTPFFADQFDNAAHVAKAKVGVATAQFSKITPHTLAAAIHACTAPDVQSAAQVLGAKLRDEDGLQNAAHAIVRFYDEEVRTGLYLAEHAQVMEARKRHRRRSFFAGGVLGGLHSALSVLLATTIGYV